MSSFAGKAEMEISHRDLHPPHMQGRPFQGNNLPSSRLFFQLYHYTFTPRRKVWLALKTRGKMFYTTRALND